MWGREGSQPWITTRRPSLNMVNGSSGLLTSSFLKKKNKLKLFWVEWPNLHQKKDQTDYCKKVKYKVNFKCLALCLRLRNLHSLSEIPTEVFLTIILFTLKNYFCLAPWSFCFYLIFSKMFLWNSININNCVAMQHQQ